MKTYIVDAFTTTPFKGNPAGVCFPERPLSDEEMLSVAKELGLSETAFVSTLDHDTSHNIHFFTPKSEISLCGHATLASAKVLFELLDLDELHFRNIENLDLYCRREGGRIVMTFPVYEVEASPVPQPLLKALGIREVLNSVYNRETNILMLEIESAEQLKALSPDYAALLQSHDSIDGVLVTARGKEGLYDFHSRYFWPWKGTNEDPVTGGSHTFMAPYWGKKLNKKKMHSFQASERTGFMEVDLIDDAWLLIKGDAVIVFAGEIRI